MHRHAVGMLFLLAIMFALGAAIVGQTTVTGPGQLERCDEGLFTLAFANPSPTQTACQIVFRHTPPSSEFVYVSGSGSMTVPGRGTISADPIVGSWSVDSVVGSAYELPPGGTVTVEYRLATTCLAVSGTATAEVSYVDCAQPGTQLQTSDSVSVEVLPGAVTVIKTPSNPPGGVGDLVTWTLAVNSTGLGSIKNVVVTDTLGPGLEYVSSSPSGVSAARVVAWDSGDIPALSDMDPNTSVTITLIARVIACTGLENELDARCGCDDGTICTDTSIGLGECGSGTATSSVAFVQRLPFLEFNAPTITIPYCAATTTVTLPIENSGDGTAHGAALCPSSFGSLVISNVQGGATYVGGCFYLPDIAGGTTFNLQFDVTYTGDWCTSAPSGSPLYTLDYTNDCGVLHRATPRFGSIGASASPGLSVTKTGPSVVQYGSEVSYNITAIYSGPVSCGSTTTSTVTVVDQLPAGFAVVASAGGVWAPGPGNTGGTVTWTFDPAVSSSSGWELIVQVPLDCGFCYTEQTNMIVASALSCCGCALTASSSATMAITCERLYTSTLTFVPTSTLERCGDAVTFTDAHTFDDDVALESIAFSDFVYAFIKENGLAYVPGSAAATIDGVPTPVTVTDGLTEVTITATDARSVRGHTLVFSYGMRATSASLPACGGASSFYVWASHEIPEVGPCTRFYDTQLLTIQPPSMSVGISGVPTIQEDCATYSVTLSFQRTSSLADPYDARLVLAGTSGVIADFAGATWSGVTPSEAPIVGPNTVEWRFADGFAAPGAAATLTVPVTAKCGGPLIALSATGTFDDLCNNIAGYNDTCSASASASSSLRLEGDIHISKTPEVIYTTLRTITWQIEIYNSSNGTAYNVYVDDVLGSGLVYASSSASGYSGSFTTQPNQDHLGAPINGASFLFERVAPGERPVITFTADLVACNNMTNTATVGWGCGGDACQTPRSDGSYVLVAPANVVSTSLAPTPIDACSTQKATVTLRSAGIATAYNLSATATLPPGLVYVGNPEVRVSGGPWGAAGAPSGIPGPVLTWDKDEIPALAAAAPGVTIDVRFDVRADCSFNGGTLLARSSYQNPCGQTFLSGIGSFTIAARRPTLALVATQTSPVAGQPIPCGGNVTWEVRVTNSGPAVASAVWVEQTMGAGLTYVSSTGGTDGGSGSGQTATWEIQNLGVGATAVLTATAASTVGPAECSALTSSIRAYWACGPDGSSATLPDCLASTYASASTTATRAVSVTAAATMSPNSVGSCETQKTLTVTLTNTSTSAPAYNPDVRLTLPAGLAYRAGTTEINCGAGFAAAADPVQAGQVLTWYNTASTGVGNDLCASIPASGSVAVRFQVDAACYRTTAAATLNLYYYDCCGATQYTVTSSPSLTASSPTLSVTMAPSTATLDCANPSNTVTWTITVTNTGGSTAGFVRVVDTLGADLVRVSGGTQIGANPQQWGWEFGPLAPGGSQSVTLEARLAAPPNDCAVARRTSTAVTSWGCTALALDGDPNTTTEYSCTSSGGSVTRTATVLVPDLSISSSDIVPQFTCASDGISNGRMLLTVRNTGTAAISTNFSLSFSESTTGWSGGGTFTSLGGTLPLASGGNQVLTLSGWPITCSSCSYQFTATIDTGGAICECRENNNTATLSYTPTSPDLVVASSTLAPTCSGDGQVRIQGNVTLRNQGCGAAAFTTNVPMRFTVYAGATCSGTVLDQWTQTFTGVNIAAGGGTQAFAVDRTATYNTCTPCQISILIEADSTNAICECSGTNNTFCAGPLSIAFPDLVVSEISFAGLSCASDTFSGSVAVTVTNQGCGAAGAFNLGLTTGGCLTFASQRVTSVAAGSSVVVQFPVSTAWSGCGTCGCTFTATVDTGGEVCECTGANNSATASYTSSLPDLTITAFSASAASPCAPGSAQVTVRNSGCGTAPSGVVIGITGAATGQAATTVALAAGETQTITVPFAAPVGCGTGYAVTATVDPANAVCECTGANNTASTTFSVSAPDLVVSNVIAVCNLDDTFTVTATVANSGGQPANGISIRVYADGTLTHDETQSIAAGAAYALSYVTPPLLCATPHAIRVVADETSALCECAEANNEGAAIAATCACPGLTTAKSITNVWRRGASVWPVSAVESGDVVEYQVVIANNGAATAFHVDLADTLPDGLVYFTSAPAHDGQYALSAGGSGAFSVPAGGTTFTTTIHATLAAGQSITFRYCARAGSSIEQGDILTNIARADGQEGSGREIPAGSGSATLSAARPALNVDKTIVDVVRNGSSRGASGPVEPGDVVFYRFVVRNVGQGTAYGVGISDALPTGLEIETAPPGSTGTYTVSAPASSGPLSLTSGLASFTVSLGATLAGGATLTADYAARVTSAAVQGTALVNVARAAGVDSLGGAIPVSNVAAGDTSDDDLEDADADDTGIASIGVAEPALSVDKQVVDVRRGGSSIGVVDPVLYGDVIIYRATVRNVGLGTAYDVDLADTLPSGIVMDTSAPVGAGTYAVSLPASGGSLGLGDGATGFSTSIAATIAGGETLTADFAARIAPNAPLAVWLSNTVTATGRDGAGTTIPGANAALGDTSDDDEEDSDADDTGIAPVRVGMPALVTEKAVTRIVRAAREVPATSVEVGDVVTYALRVRNVGIGHAFSVSLADVLPPGMTYLGPTAAVWAGGSSSGDPTGLPGASLAWPLGATLAPGDEIALTFAVSVSGPIRQGQSYKNTLSATGVDGAGTPIPADNQALVPEDTDPDDTSEVSLAGARPALVTDKQILNIVRDGRSLGASAPIATGDVVEFQLAVANVGLGSAYGVDVRDSLPAPLTFVPGTTSASWPSRSGTYEVDPVGSPGPNLVWPTGADLAPGDSLTLRFQARVDGPVSSAVVYRNVLVASGLDGGRGIIPANNVGDVPEDVDADDRDDVVLTAAASTPALVTAKGIAAVRRDGQLMHDGVVELGDVVTYELIVENVGPVPAYRVDIHDTLPPQFAYVPGSTVATAPAFFSTADPGTVAGTLEFRLQATLDRGEQAVVRFDAAVSEPIVDGRSYVNSMRAVGTNAAGVPIPADQQATVPADIDSDDASSASIRGRSWILEGAGGLINAPILRKTAETLEASACLGAAAVVDRVWFQTDIAMFAATEFASFAREESAPDVFSDTLLPIWTRTVRDEFGRYALENLLQVEVLSSLGVSLRDGPRIVEAAAKARVSNEVALAGRLADLAQRAGVTDDDAVPDGRWTYLEAEAGEPVFRSSRDTPWGSVGEWTFVDGDLVTSSLGMSLLRQAQAAETLIASADAGERYVGWILAEAMANKLVALDRDLTARPTSGPAYIPHVARTLGVPGRFEIADSASVLFDHVSLVWGAARTLEFLRSTSADWPASELGLAAALESGARAVLIRAADAVAAYHVAADGRMVARSPGSPDGNWIDASTVDVALLVLATDAALGVGGDAADTLRALQAAAVALLLSRQGVDGRFASVSPTANVDTELASQFAGLYALLVAGRIPAAERTFDFLEQRAWDDWKGFGLYRLPETGDAPLCYTALDIGLAVGALRELAARGDTDRSPLALQRLAAFARSILDDAALQLDNAGDESAARLAAGAGRSGLLGIAVEDASALAPVLQRSLCLVDAAAAAACGGLRVLPDDPWYQTDIAMIASYMLQDSNLGRADDADANLIAVDFHSGLGVPFAAYSSLAGAVASFAREVGASSALDPIVVPYFAGDPYLGAEADADLAWNPLAFDTRVVPSAIGMTLLREAQEAGELGRKAVSTPEDELTARVLAASAVGKLSALEDLVLAGPGGVRYIAHTYSAIPEAGDVRMDIVDRTSDLFDQVSLLFGLTEFVRLARDPGAARLLAAVAATSDRVEARCASLASIVLGTLESAHRRPLQKVLADLAAPSASGWIPGDSVSARSLGLVMMALERTRETFGDLAERSRVLLAEQAAFLNSSLWDGSGGFREMWNVERGAAALCEAPTLSGQLGALGGLLVADRLAGGGASGIRSALLALDARFWDPEAEVYVGRLDHLSWCMTPLDLALAVSVLPQACAYIDPIDAEAIGSRLARHVDRSLDGADLQIPARSLGEEGQDQAYAPVFDRRVCIEPRSPLGGLAWTRPGDRIRYTIEAENPSPEAFFALVLDDLLPEGVSLVAASPEAAGDGRSLRWMSARLDPGSRLTWQIDVRVDPSAELGETFTNCAKLTYTDAAGVGGSPREACAAVTLGSADGARASGIENAPVAYRTDEAMRLALALEDLADRGLLGAAAVEARAASRANVGVLLGESGLGVPLSLAPMWTSPEQAADALALLASEAGLPGTPGLALPIFLPAARGVPILERGSGFVGREDEITPAAIGWTLAREAQLLDASGGSRDGLTGYLAGFVEIALGGQLAWLNDIAGSSGAAAHFVHGVEVRTVDGKTEAAITDARSLVYDQASLLAGLARVAGSQEANADTIRAATNLAIYVLSDLAELILVDGTIASSLDAGSAAARWADSVVAVRALADAADSIPRVSSQARGLIAAAVRPARASSASLPQEELARVGLLLIAARSLGDRPLQQEGLAAWKAWASAARGRDGRLAFAAAASAGWRYFPAEIALALETLAEVAAADPNLAADVAVAATDLVRGDLLADRVQLWTPIGYWRDHVGLPCLDAAPVFAIHSGPPSRDPVWTLRQP